MSVDMIKRWKQKRLNKKIADTAFGGFLVFVLLLFYMSMGEAVLMRVLTVGNG